MSRVSELLSKAQLALAEATVEVAAYSMTDEELAQVKMIQQQVRVLRRGRMRHVVRYSRRVVPQNTGGAE